MMDRVRDIPVLGTLFAGVADLLLFSGETIAALLMFAVSSVEVWFPLMNYLNRLGDRLEWVPTHLFEPLMIVGLVLFVGIYLRRLARRAKGNKNDGS